MDEIHIARIKQRIPGAACPGCGRSAEGGTFFSDDGRELRPKPGDFAICVYCGEIHAYDGRLHLRALTRAERRLLERDARLKALRAVASRAAEQQRKEWQ